MKITFVTTFRSLIEPYFEDSVLKKARDRGAFAVDFINPRDFSRDRWKKTDDIVSGGGAGMLMTCQPLFDALKFARSRAPKARIIFPLPAAKPFNNRDARRLASRDEIVFVCGRYEGIDERVIETFADEVFSVGDFVVTGGELPAAMMSDAILRFVGGVLGDETSAIDESFETGLLEAPNFTKPAVFKDRGVKRGAPDVLLNGNHKMIAAYRNSLAKLKTLWFRPDL
ncbi:MAG: tRNA (guanosine(37)-N1)-methyltransferase TrmD [Helicobacteraceae bacterium]|jgi:tRNA (guanine37-N1)-methyltransferase|nr:tRNA (guanosine(37)-N1)-methyltransferase TrmD [Helicobacteraceae bacterium]